MNESRSKDNAIRNLLERLEKVEFKNEDLSVNEVKADKRTPLSPAVGDTHAVTSINIIVEGTPAKDANESKDDEGWTPGDPVKQLSKDVAADSGIILPKHTIVRIIKKLTPDEKKLTSGDYVVMTRAGYIFVVAEDEISESKENESIIVRRICADCKKEIPKDSKSSVCVDCERRRKASTNNFDNFKSKENESKVNEIKHDQEYYDYLDDLRKSGDTNMFGAASYLVQEFGIDKHLAREILSDWMETFEERHKIDKAKALASNYEDYKKEVKNTSDAFVIYADTEGLADEFKNAIEHIGGYVYDLPSAKGQYSLAFIVSKKKLSDKDIKEIDVVMESKLPEADSKDAYKIIARGVSDKAIADRIATERKGRVIADEKDGKKFMVVTSESKGNEVDYNELAKKIGGKQKERFLKYMNKRWPDSGAKFDWGYANTWADRFSREEEWEFADSEGQAILKEIDPCYANQKETGRTSTAGPIVKEAEEAVRPEIVSKCIKVFKAPGGKYCYSCMKERQPLGKDKNKPEVNEAGWKYYTISVQNRFKKYLVQRLDKLEAEKKLIKDVWGSNSASTNALVRVETMLTKEQLIAALSKDYPVDELPQVLDMKEAKVTEREEVCSCGWHGKTPTGRQQVCPNCKGEFLKGPDREAKVKEGKLKEKIVPNGSVMDKGHHEVGFIGQSEWDNTYHFVGTGDAIKYEEQWSDMSLEALTELIRQAGFLVSTEVGVEPVEEAKNALELKRMLMNKAAALEDKIAKTEDKAKKDALYLQLSDLHLEIEGVENGYYKGKQFVESVKEANYKSANCSVCGEVYDANGTSLEKCTKCLDKESKVKEALPGEVTGGKNETTCTECGAKLPLKVLKSGAGYYYGYWCPECGPYGRESGYFGTKEEAEAAMHMKAELRDTDYYTKLAEMEAVKPSVEIEIPEPVAVDPGIEESAIAIWDIHTNKFVSDGGKNIPMYFADKEPAHKYIADVLIPKAIGSKEEFKRRFKLVDINDPSGMKK